MKSFCFFIFLVSFFVPCCLLFSQDQIADKSNDGILMEAGNKSLQDMPEKIKKADINEEKPENFSSPVEPDESSAKEVGSEDDLDDSAYIDEGPDIEDEIKKEILSEDQDNDSTLDLLLDPSDIEQMKKLQVEISIKPADVILLKDGESIEGVIRDKTTNIISIETEYGLKVYNKEDIDFIDEISEQEKFYLLDKIEALQVFHKKSKERKLKEEKKELQAQEEKAQQATQTLEKLTDQETTNLFSLTNLRLEEIIKEFSQFPPDYWRYYHRKGDAQKAVLRLRRLERFAHPQILETIKLYLQAFDNKIKQLDSPDDSLSRETYKDNYRKFFRNAEKRRMVLKDTEFN